MAPHRVRRTRRQVGRPGRNLANATLVLAKNDIATVALWLGHESKKSTEVYVDSNTTIKQEAIDKIGAIDTPPGRYKPNDTLLAFLESL